MVIKTFVGHVSGEDFVRSAREVAEAPEFDSLQFIINDFRLCTGHSIDTKALEEIAVIRFGALPTNPNIRVLVVSTDSRFAELAAATRRPPLDGSQETRAFPSIEAALGWMAEQPILQGPRAFRAR